MDAHELIAPYALDALDEREREEFEAHLRSCDRCRAELPALREAAAAMSFAADAPAPPDRLRGRILDAARRPSRRHRATRSPGSTSRAWASSGWSSRA